MSTALWILLVIFAWPIVIILGIVVALVCVNYEDTHPKKVKKPASKRQRKPTKPAFCSPIKRANLHNND